MGIGPLPAHSTQATCPMTLHHNTSGSEGRFHTNPALRPAIAPVRPCSVNRGLLSEQKLARIPASAFPLPFSENHDRLFRLAAS